MEGDAAHSNQQAHQRQPIGNDSSIWNLTTATSSEPLPPPPLSGHDAAVLPASFVSALLSASSAPHATATSMTSAPEGGCTLGASAASAVSSYFSSFSPNFEFLSSSALTNGVQPPSFLVGSCESISSTVATFLKADDLIGVGGLSDTGISDEVGTPAPRNLSPQDPTSPISSGHCTPRNTHTQDGDTPGTQLSGTGGNIFVTHLPSHVDDIELRALFEPFGAIVSSVVMRDIFSGTSRGVGFVLFEDASAADLAIAAMHRSTVAGKTITVQRGKQFSQGTPTTRVFIRNIPKGITEAQVRDLCAPFGQITWLSVHSDSVKSSSKAPRRNIAFVNYTTVEEAKLAADALHATRPFMPGEGLDSSSQEQIVPILTKVVVENLPTKTTRKERRTTCGEGKERADGPATSSGHGGPHIPQTVNKQATKGNSKAPSKKGAASDVHKPPQVSNADAHQMSTTCPSAAAGKSRRNRHSNKQQNMCSEKMASQGPPVTVSVGCVPPPPPPYRFAASVVSSMAPHVVANALPTVHVVHQAHSVFPTVHVSVGGGGLPTHPQQNGVQLGQRRFVNTPMMVIPSQQ